MLKPPSLSPPPLTFRQFERPLDEITPAISGKIITHNERIGPKITTFSEKINMPSNNNNNNSKKFDKNVNINSNNDKSKINRRCSWKLSSKSSLKRKKTRSGSDSDAIPLNNGRDHSQCNGGGVQRHVSFDCVQIGNV